MPSTGRAPRSAVLGMRPANADLRDLPLTELRSRRKAARSRLELAQLRARQSRGSDDPAIEALRCLAEDLTEELIRRYAEDPALIDAILDEPVGKAQS